MKSENRKTQLKNLEKCLKKRVCLIFNYPILSLIFSFFPLQQKDELNYLRLTNERIEPQNDMLREKIASVSSENDDLVCFMHESLSYYPVRFCSQGLR